MEKEFNENELDNVLGGTLSYEENLKLELAKLQKELLNSNNNSQERTQIYEQMCKLQAELDDLNCQKFSGKRR